MHNQSYLLRKIVGKFWPYFRKGQQLSECLLQPEGDLNDSGPLTDLKKSKILFPATDIYILKLVTNQWTFGSIFTTFLSFFWFSLFSINFDKNLSIKYTDVF